MLREIEESHKIFKINFRKMSEPLEGEADADILLFEERDSYFTSLTLFESVIAAYSEKIAIIILSANRETLNVVRWMRNGATDYLWLGNFSGEILLSSVRGTLAFLAEGEVQVEREDEAVEEAWGDNYAREKVKLPQECSWDSLKDDGYYDFALVSINVSTDRYAVGRYSELSKEKIYSQIKQELEVEVKRFGGRIWLWNNGSGLLAFHFGDAVNCAVLAAISFYNNFFLTCIKKLKLDELLKIKLAVHWGNSIYHKSNTENITSDTLNSLIHLINNFAPDDSIMITGDVYEQLSVRVKNYFAETESFEGNKIFDYDYRRL